MHESRITKEEYYRFRGESYPFDDPEAALRYRRAIGWMRIEDNLVVREVGCKYAVLRDLLENAVSNADYMAVDIDEATLKKIPNYDPAQFCVHNVNNGLPFESASTDYLFCLEVLEHLENPTVFLTEAKRILKPGGKLIISVPNPYCWMELLWNYRRLPDGEGHIASFTHQNIDALLKFAGLSLCQMIGTYTHIPFSRRIFGTYKMLETDNIFLTRSYLYLIENKKM